MKRMSLFFCVLLTIVIGFYGNSSAQSRRVVDLKIRRGGSIAVGGIIGIYVQGVVGDYVVVVPKMVFFVGTYEKPKYVVIPELKLPTFKKYSIEMSVESYQFAAFNVLFRSRRGIYSGSEKDVIELLDIKPNSVVVDVGCGAGYYVYAFADRAKKVIATDLNPASCDYIKWLGKLSANGVFGKPKKYNNVITQVNSIDDVNLNCMVDRYFLNNVHYFIDPANDYISDKFTKSMLKHLKRGGKMLVIEWIPRRSKDGKFVTRGMEDTIKYFGKFGLKVEKKILQEESNRYIILFKKV